MSQAELARLIGCVTNHVSDLERGERGLTVDWMRKIAAALDCSPADLLNYADNPDRLDERERALFQLYRAMPDDMRATLERLAQALLPDDDGDADDSDAQSA